LTTIQPEKKRGRPPKLRTVAVDPPNAGEEAVANTIADFDPIQAFIDKLDKLKALDDGKRYR
jgi:hypothetical protein